MVHDPTNANRHIKLCLLNAQSLVNKATDICELIQQEQIDILALTETWLYKNEDVVLNEATPPGYKILHTPRNSGRGGGVGVIYNESISVVKVAITMNADSFEYIETMIKSGEEAVRLIAIYCPLPSKKNKLTSTLFLKEFAEFVEIQTVTTGKLIMAGDFNIHLDNPKDSFVSNFCDIIQSANLLQHVKGSTHKRGHTLDLIITRSIENTIQDVCVNDSTISDHYSVSCYVNMEKSKPPRITMEYRKFRSINVAQFKEDIKDSILYNTSDTETPVSDLSLKYHDVMSYLIDKHAPIQKRSMIIRKAAPWMNDEIKMARCERRRAERHWRYTKLSVYRQIYKTQ